MPADRLAVVTDSPPRVLAIDLLDGSRSVIAVAGEGPGELGSRVAFVSGVGDSLFVHGFQNFRSNLYVGEEFSGQIRHDVLPLSVVFVGGEVVAEMYVSADRVGRAALGNSALLAILEDASARENRPSWAVKTEIVEADFSDYPQVDFTMNLFWRLQPRDSTSFYRIPLWGRKTIEVWSASGNLVSEIEIPTDFARAIPDDRAGLAQYAAEDLLVLKDAKSDRSGRLHLLAPSTPDRDQIIVLDTGGEVVGRYRFESRLSCLGVSPRGDEYVGIDVETGSVLRMVVTP